jgi:hypothetical protein
MIGKECTNCSKEEESTDSESDKSIESGDPKESESPDYPNCMFCDGPNNSNVGIYWPKLKGKGRKFLCERCQKLLETQLLNHYVAFIENGPRDSIPSSSASKDPCNLGVNKKSSEEIGKKKRTKKNKKKKKSKHRDWALSVRVPLST